MGLTRFFSALAGTASRTASPAEPLTAELLFRRHGRDVVRFVRRMMGPHAPAEDVDDVVQQVFVSVHRDLARFRGDSAVTTWLYGISARAVLMHARTGRRRQRAMAAYAGEHPLAHVTGETAEDAVARRQEIERVWRALERLKPKKRVVFVLHEIEGLSGKEIAKALELNEATVWTRLFHARKELVRALGEERDR
ncbi:RNA polymerase sigma factor [Myxococcota bacterium]|nr:RNA polymerase sigma factor [Myxococcota bacterium]